MELLDKMLAGDVGALSRLISMIEEDEVRPSEIVEEIYKHLGGAYCVGVTGPPGIGKSTMIDGLTSVIRHRELSVGSILVDPTSRFSGGALLGDRIRLQRHNLDRAVFMRSMASRGKSGGLSKKVAAVIRLLDAFGKDYVFVETVGVGQLEMDIVDIADTVVLVLAPQGGDIVQFMKAGIMEICDVLVINKADLGGADDVIACYESLLKRRQLKDSWVPPVVETQALHGVGLAEVCGAIEAHSAFLAETGLGASRRSESRRREFDDHVRETLLELITDCVRRNASYLSAKSDVGESKADPYQASEDLLADQGLWDELASLSPSGVLSGTRRKER